MLFSKIYPHGLLAIAGDFWWDMFIRWRFRKVFVLDLAVFQINCNLVLLLPHDSIHFSNQTSLLPNLDQFACKLTFVNYIILLVPCLKKRFKTFISLILLGDVHFLTCIFDFLSILKKFFNMKLLIFIVSYHHWLVLVISCCLRGAADSLIHVACARAVVNSFLLYSLPLNYIKTMKRTLLWTWMSDRNNVLYMYRKKNKR